MCEDTLILKASKIEPNCKEEFKRFGMFWPVNFHPSQQERDREKGISPSDLSSIYANITQLKEDKANVCKLLAKVDCGGAIIVNPSNNGVLATSYEALVRLSQEHGDGILQHPLYTPAYLCIDEMGHLARHQNMTDKKGTFISTHPLH